MKCPNVKQDDWKACEKQGECGAGTLYGYARVSSQDQCLARQMDALIAFGVEQKNIYTDKASGKDFNRPAWHALTRRLHKGDALVITSIDRLGRNYDEILMQWRAITRERGAAIVVLDMPLLDTRKSNTGVTGELIADIVLQLLSYVAHVERDNIHKRQAEGIASAHERGVKFGRPRKKRPECYPTVLEAFNQGSITRSKAAEVLGVSMGTFDHWRKEDVCNLPS